MFFLSKTYNISCLNLLRWHVHIVSNHSTSYHRWKKKKPMPIKQFNPIFEENFVHGKSMILTEKEPWKRSSNQIAWQDSQSITPSQMMPISIRETGGEAILLLG
uniref:Uncharacterized protein n=1 Tax=Picea sitchensis TaxID=3332 RepID=D5AAM1_PICSI|nr:unknown [Picea sitchensis]